MSYFPAIKPVALNQSIGVWYTQMSQQRFLPAVEPSNQIIVGTIIYGVGCQNYYPAIELQVSPTWTVYIVGTSCFIPATEFYFNAQVQGICAMPIVQGELTLSGNPAQQQILGIRTDFEMLWPSVGLGDTVLFVAKSANNGTALAGIWCFDGANVPRDSVTGQPVPPLEFQKAPSVSGNGVITLQWRGWPGIEVAVNETDIYVKGAAFRIGSDGFIQIGMTTAAQWRYTKTGTYQVLYEDQAGNRVIKTVRVRGYTLMFSAAPPNGPLPLSVQFTPRMVMQP